MGIIWDILLLSVAVFVVARVMPSIHIESYLTAAVVALVYSVVNYLLGWLLAFLALPLIYITFGLFKFVINAFLLWVTDKIIEDFEIRDIGSTLVAAFLITVIDSVLKWVF